MLLDIFSVLTCELLANKCDINDINKYRFVAYKPVSPAMIDSMTMLIRQLQEKEQQQQ